jgi:hypothetical protein
MAGTPCRGSDRRLQFHKRGQLLIRTHNETLSVALTRVYDDAGNVIQTHERKGDLKEW